MRGSCGPTAAAARAQGSKSLLDSPSICRRSNGRDSALACALGCRLPPAGLRLALAWHGRTAADGEVLKSVPWEQQHVPNCPLADADLVQADLREAPT